MVEQSIRNRQVSGPPVGGFAHRRIQQYYEISKIYVMIGVYAIYSPSLDLIYSGQSANIEKRVSDHRNGYSKYTSKARDWILFYTETCSSRAQAMKREKQLKSYQGRLFLKSQLEIFRNKQNEQS